MVPGTLDSVLEAEQFFLKSMTSQIQAVHDVYRKLTGYEPNYKINERVYADYLSKGFTPDDLRIVLEYLLRENKRMRGAAYSVRLDKLLDFEYLRFDGFLNEAKAKARNRRGSPSPRDRVLAAYMKTVDNEKAPQSLVSRSVKEILRSIVNS